MQGGIGPMAGQAGHFLRAATITVNYGIKRYVDETERLYQVLERGLEGKKWLVGDAYSIADISNFSWTLFHYALGKPQCSALTLSQMQQLQICNVYS